MMYTKHGALSVKLTRIPNIYDVKKAQAPVRGVPWHFLEHKRLP